MMSQTIFTNRGVRDENTGQWRQQTGADAASDDSRRVTGARVCGYRIGVRAPAPIARGFPLTPCLRARGSFASAQTR